MSGSSVQDVIGHYQRSIEKTSGDEPRLIHCLEKLNKLPVTVNHLQETGVGRTVNSLRKYEGEVGVAAKALVSKWKAMVAAEESSDADGVRDEHSEDNGDDDHHPTIEEPPVLKYELSKPRMTESHSQGPGQDLRRDSIRKKATEEKYHSSEEEVKVKLERHSPVDSEEDILHVDNKVAMVAEIKTEPIDTCIKQEADAGHTVKSSSHNHSHKSSRHSDRHKRHHGDRERERSSGKSKHREKVKVKVEIVKVESTDDVAKPKDHSRRHRSSEKSDNSTPATSSKKRRVESTEQSSKSNGRKNEEADGDGIDCSMGASFAEALQMSYAPSTSGSSKKKMSAPTVSSSSTFSTPRRQPTVRNLLEIPIAKLNPIDPAEITQSVFNLPAISNNYVPMPLNQTIMECVFSANGKGPAKRMTDEEAFGTGISSKITRSKMYTGFKTTAILPVPSLHELCIRVLQKNIDAMEYTGGVPFDILKPVLERATPHQLITFEHYNPYLMDDSDLLWEKHCIRKFRGLKRQELECWREMYSRCEDERDARLTSLTENIKQSQSSSLPVKTTKLAYVDSAVKPPRSIQAKQNRFGTDRKLIATPAARVASLSNPGMNMAKPGDVRLRIAPGLRDTAQATAFRPKKAPLMQKTLQLMKGRFKR